MYPASHVILLDQIEEGRDKVRAAIAQSLQELLGDIKKDTVLDVGSGLGYLNRVWPFDFKRFVNLEPQKAFFKTARERGATGEFVGGNVYELPFEDNSFDLVTGMASYDMFMDLESALDETHRVLKPGGHFVHIMDVDPNGSTILEDFSKQGFPTADLKQDHFGLKQGCIMYIPDKNVINFDKYAKVESIEKDFQRFAKVIHAHRYFQKKMARYLTHQFENISVGSKVVSCKRPREDIHKIPSENGFYELNFRFGELIFSRKLGHYMRCAAFMAMASRTFWYNAIARRNLDFAEKYIAPKNAKQTYFFRFAIAQKPKESKTANI